MVAMRQFHERQATEPTGESTGEERDDDKNWDEAAKRWCELWPDDPEVWLARFQALARKDDATAEELLSTADTLLEKLAGRPDFRAEPLVPFQIARTFVEKDVGLDRVPGLVRRGLDQLEQMRTRFVGEGPEAALVVSPIDQMLAYQGWVGRQALVEAYLKQRRYDDARAELTTMEGLLPEAGSSSGGLDDAYQSLYLRSTWLSASADLALAESRKVDALLYRNAALILEPGPQVGPREEMATIWRELGASEDAVRSWLTLGLPTADPLGQPVQLELPEFEFQDLAGQTWRLSDLSGKAVLINVWATWCPPCLDELPYLQKLHERVKDRPGLVVLTLNVDENPGVVEPLMRRHGYDFPVVFAYDYMLDLWGYQWAIPCTYIVDRNGTVRRELSGFDADQENWQDRVLGAMAEVAAESRRGPGS
jgi:thiol-disulfide isomerase/thioredoxin